MKAMINTILFIFTMLSAEVAMTHEKGISLYLDVSQDRRVCKYAVINNLEYSIKLDGEDLRLSSSSNKVPHMITIQLMYKEKIVSPNIYGLPDLESWNENIEVDKVNVLKKVESYVLSSKEKIVGSFSVSDILLPYLDYLSKNGILKLDDKENVDRDFKMKFFATVFLLDQKQTVISETDWMNFNLDKIDKRQSQ